MNPKKLLFSNAYTLLVIGSTNIIENTNLKQGIIYITLGLFLLAVEMVMLKEQSKEERKEETSSLLDP